MYFYVKTARPEKRRSEFEKEEKYVVLLPVGEPIVDLKFVAFVPI